MLPDDTRRPAGRPEATGGPEGPGRSMTPQTFEVIAQRFRLLAEPMRLRILFHLQEGQMAVGDLAARVGTTQSNLSKHLAALYHGGLVQRQRDGTSVLYSVADPSIFELCDIVCGGIGQNLDEQRSRLP